jgi:hypothetical protein
MKRKAWFLLMNETNKQKEWSVKESYDFDEELLEELADGNPYWNKVQTFYLDNKNKNIEMMSEKQIAWLDRITFELNEKE